MKFHLHAASPNRIRLQIAWALFAVGVAAIALALAKCRDTERSARERTQRVMHEIERHRRLVDHERPEVLKLADAIQNELRDDEDVKTVPLVGTFSWGGGFNWGAGLRLGDRGNGEGLILSQSGKVVWWWGSPKLEEAVFVDHGTIAFHGSEEVIVDWAVNAVSPHRASSIVGPLLLDRVLVIVRHGKDVYVVPLSRVGIVTSDAFGVFDDPLFYAPRLGGWDIDQALPGPRPSIQGLSIPTSYSQGIIGQDVVVPCLVLSREGYPVPRETLAPGPTTMDRIIETVACRSSNQTVVRTLLSSSLDMKPSLSQGTPLFGPGFLIPAFVVESHNGYTVIETIDPEDRIDKWQRTGLHTSLRRCRAIEYASIGYRPSANEK